MLRLFSPAGSLHLSRPCALRTGVRAPILARSLTTDNRNRLSNFFAPSGGITPTSDGQQEDVHSLLIRTGFLRQAYSGIFHYLPLGHRVHEKLERLIDKHMRTIGASKLSLSTISGVRLWAMTGRLEKGGNEQFRFKDRKGNKFLLSPTYEEEVTEIIASLVKSYRQLPLRVYQIGRKFRDERRPRAGLLRAREFTMKDLYTFDSTESSALETYNEVRTAYKNLFDELKLPYIVAEADSGIMGGTLSHEYCYPSSSGEDTIYTCTSCTYSSNAEVACSRPPTPPPRIEDPSNITVFHGITQDHKTLLNVFYPRDHPNTSANEVNIRKLKSLYPEFNPSVSSSALELFIQNFTEYHDGATPGSYSEIVNLFDLRLPYSVTEASFSSHSDQPLFREFIVDKRIPTTSVTSDPSSGVPLNLLKVNGDGCPECDSGTLTCTTAIELGHTFHLGTRYSTPLKAVVKNEKRELKSVEMGCHGIGLSRMISAVADGYRDEKGLCWPRAAAPFEVVVVYKDESMRAGAEEVYDLLEEGRMDTLLDDREKDLVWQMKDAELVGYPVCVVLGREWENGVVEVQNRRAKTKVEVRLEELRETVEGVLGDL